MKKITFIAALLLGSMAFSQTVIIDRAPNTSGYYSEYWDADEVGLYSADYFELTSNVSVSELVFPGFTVIGTNQVPGDGLFLDFSLYIYSSAGTVPDGDPLDPSTAFISITNISLSDFTITNGGGNNTDFTLDVTAANGGVPIVLPAGEYWMSPVPTIEQADPNWYWLGSDGILANDAVVNDPYDLFGEGFQGWTSITSIQTPPATFPSFAWTMSGEVLGVNDNVMSSVSVYPNPTSDILNIKTPSNIEVNSVALFDVLGKQVMADYSNGTINMSALSQGVYLLKVETSAGTLTQKVVKQ